MIVNDLLKADYVLLTDDATKDLKIDGIYASDLLSNVLKSAKEHNVLITTLANLNTVAVCVMIDLPCIILCEDKIVSLDMIAKANEESVAIIKTSKKSYEVILDLHHQGVI